LFDYFNLEKREVMNSIQMAIFSPKVWKVLTFHKTVLEGRHSPKEMKVYKEEGIYEKMELE
jgi:hypothetical protein